MRFNLYTIYCISELHCSREINTDIEEEPHSASAVNTLVLVTMFPHVVLMMNVSRDEYHLTHSWSQLITNGIFVM